MADPNDYSGWSLHPAQPQAPDLSGWTLQPAKATPRPKTEADWAAAHPTMDQAATLVDKAVNALPLGKQAVDLASGAILHGATGGGVKLTPQAEADAKRLGVKINDTSLGADISRLRAAREAQVAQEAARNPTTANVGTGLGIGLSLLAPLPKVPVGAGAGLIAKAGAGALTGAGYGALPDVLEGNWGDVPKDALIGLGLGAGGTLAAEGLQKAAPWVLKKATEAGRRVLTNGADSLSKRGAVRADAVEEALSSGAIKPFSTTQGALSRLQDLTAEQGAKYGEIVSKLEAAGVRGPDADALAEELLAQATKLRPTTMNESLPAEYETKAKELLAKIPKQELTAGRALPRALNPAQPPGLVPVEELGIRAPVGQWAEPPISEATANTRLPKTLASKVPATPEGRTLGLSQAEALKRSLQQQAKYGRFEETPLNEVRRDIASRFRQSVENAIGKAAGAAPEGSEIQQLAGEFVPAKQRLGRLLEAESAAERGVARGAQRGGLSLTDAALAAGELAAGNPIKAAATAGLSSFMRNRGRSAVASYGYDLGNALAAGKLSEPAFNSLVKAYALRQSLLPGRSLGDENQGQ